MIIDRFTKLVSKFTLLLLALILIAGLVIRVSYGLAKDGYHEDEFATVASIIGFTNEKRENFFIEHDGAWFRGEELINRSFSIKKSEYCNNLKSILKTVGHTAHPNLHYLLYRAGIFFDIDAPGRLYNLYSIAYNSIFFVFTGLFLFLLLKDMFSKELALWGVLLYTFSTAAIANTLYFRMYEQLSCCFVLVVYLLHRISKKDSTEALDYIALAAAIWATFLTHYYSLLFLGMCSLAVALHYFLQKKYKTIALHAASFASALLAAQLFYHKYLPNLFMGHRGKQAVRNMQRLKGGKFVSTISSSFSILTDYYLYWLPVLLLLLLALIIYLIYTKKQKLLLDTCKGWRGYVLVIAFIFIAAVIYIAPFKTLRYVVAVFPFLSILYLFIFELIPAKMGRAIFMTLTILVSLVYLHPQLSAKNIQYNYKVKQSQLPFTSDPSAPVYIYIDNTWRTHPILPLLHEEQEYRCELFSRKAGLQLDENFPEKYYLLLDRGWHNKDFDIAKLVDQKKWKVERLSNCYTFASYKVSKE